MLSDSIVSDIDTMSAVGPGGEIEQARNMSCKVTLMGKQIQEVEWGWGW